jgi:hypothetical protein
LLEGAYKTQLSHRIEERFAPRAMVVRLDSALLQGVPDLLVLFEGGFWAALEGKTSARAKKQPNQPWWVANLDRLCFSAFIYPENEEAVLNELAEEFETHWAARLS